MSFLAPLFLLGAVAVALPVYFHLIRRQTHIPKPFSSLLFLRASPPVMTQKRRLEDLLLLILRCLALALVALGFARPFVQKHLPLLPHEEKRYQRVLLVDTSASMRRENLWSETLKKSETVLRASKTTDDLALLTFGREVRTVIGFEEWRNTAVESRLGLAKGRLNSSPPGWSATSLGKALLAAVEMLQEQNAKTDEAINRQIVVFSDLQQGSRLDGLQGFEWPKGIEVVLESVAPADPSNASVQWLVETTASYGKEIRPRVRVRNSGDAKREQFRLAFQEPAVGEGTDLYVPAGQSRVIDAPALPADADWGRLELKGDGADFDNSVFLFKPVVETVKVVFLGDEKTDDPAQSLFYVVKAFGQSQAPRIEVVSKPGEVEQALNSQPPVALAVVTELPSGPIIEALRRFVTDGGQVLWILKSAAAGQSLARLLGVAGLEVTEAPSANYFMMGQIDFEHPLFKPFADARFSDFTRVYFWRHRRLKAEQLPQARIVARFDDGDPALIETPVSKGRVYVLCSAWTPEDSQLARSSKFVPFLFTFLDQAGGLKARSTQYIIGDTVDLPAGAGVTAVQIPDGTRVALPAQSTVFSQTEKPGLYRLVTSGPAISFVVNLDAAEGRTEPLSLEELGQLGIPLKHREVERTLPGAKEENERSQLISEAQQKLWRWFIAAGIVLLLMETWLAGWITGRRARQPAAMASA